MAVLTKTNIFVVEKNDRKFKRESKRSYDNLMKLVGNRSLEEISAELESMVKAIDKEESID